MSETTEFFVMASSFAAPFVSDTSTQYVSAVNAREALEKAAAEYRHPAGLYAAVCYASADAYHKGEAPVARWLSNHEQAKIAATTGKAGYVYRGDGPGDFVLDGKHHTVADPKGGSVV